MLFLAFLAAVAGQPSAAQAPVAPPLVTAPAPESRFRSLFIDWRTTGEAALQNEQARARGFAGSDLAPERQARALGDQVGEMVALGDCDGGVRLAREAGDIALVSAVEDFCRGRQAAGGVLARSDGAVPERR